MTEQTSERPYIIASDERRWAEAGRTVAALLRQALDSADALRPADTLAEIVLAMHARGLLLGETAGRRDADVIALPGAEEPRH
jgi:hypothetical protein